jgi:hypothetical protein
MISIDAPGHRIRHARAALGLTVPDGDLFVHTGDFTYRGDLKSVEAFGG